MSNRFDNQVKIHRMKHVQELEEVRLAFLEKLTEQVELADAKQQFTKIVRSSKVVYIAIASSNIQDLTGNGLEYLTDPHGNVIAVFENGKFKTITVAPLASRADREIITVAMDTLEIAA